jgi:geranylgeranyl diphosphate synthase type II
MDPTQRDATQRIEAALAAALEAAEHGGSCPPRLAAAMRCAVFPGGARIRPRLCLAIALACGDDRPAIADAAAASIELLHCASLVHDDLPCFDNADTRRGRPSVQHAFGERLAVLAGDALIVLAFEIIARACAAAPERLAPLLTAITRAVGAPRGIVAGQAWECEAAADLAEYQRLKTGSLFVAAVNAGAQAAGGNPVPWLALGERLGEAYQVADDVRDVASTAEALGKPVRQDVALGRPNAADQLGLAAAVERFDGLVARAVASIPRCSAQSMLRHLIRKESERLIPAEFIRRAA